MISATLTALARELRDVGVRGRAARRVVCEARDHLLAAAAHRGEAGAVADFGDCAATVAALVSAAVFAAGWAAEGDPGSGLARAIPEALAVLGCFALLRRPLAIARRD